MLNVWSAGGHFCFTHLAILFKAGSPQREHLIAEQGVKKACKLTAMHAFKTIFFFFYQGFG